MWCVILFWPIHQASKSLFQVNTENAHKVRGVRSKLLIMTQSDINGMVLASWLWTWTNFAGYFCFSIVEFEHISIYLDVTVMLQESKLCHITLVEQKTFLTIVSLQCKFHGYCLSYTRYGISFLETSVQTFI